MSGGLLGNPLYVIGQICDFLLSPTANYLTSEHTLQRLTENLHNK